MIPDRDYPRVFHSPGLEPWILGLLLMLGLGVFLMLAVVMGSGVLL